MTLRLGLAQINAVLGDLDSNIKKIDFFAREAQDKGVELLLFPELALTGYPPEDLLFNTWFIECNLAALGKLVRVTADVSPVMVVGFVDEVGDKLYNSAAVIYRGEIKSVYHKIILPNYGVFDERRYFHHGETIPVHKIGDVVVGITICEDIWEEDGPAVEQAGQGAQLLVNISASPYYMGKEELRYNIMAQRARETGVPVAYNNLVGGQDELIFDGQGMLIGPQGELLARGRQFVEELMVIDVPIAKPTPARFTGKTIMLLAEDHAKPPKSPLEPPVAEPLECEAEVYRALSLGLSDYVRKNGFTSVILGISGGIDSALTATIAYDALGVAKVKLVFMPSRYTADESRRDAEQLAQNLGVELLALPIDKLLTEYLKLLVPSFKGLAPDKTEENLQARIRGNLIMALSNKFGWLVLATGNKSEMSVGYATLYGDMVGGFALIKDVPKTLVYKLAEYRNRVAGHDLIPHNIMLREPSAELRENQKDSDTLPPYPVLDPIIEAYVEKDLHWEDIQGMGYDQRLITEVLKMVDRSEYKRRQAPIGIKITPKAFGKDRRMPITNCFRYSGKNHSLC